MTSTTSPDASGSAPGAGARPTAPPVDRAKARAAIRSGILAYYVDQFDIYLPIVVLAPATAYFQSASIDPGTSAILTAFVFASTLIARPLGSVVFGHYADTVGRRNTTLVAVAGFGITTLAIAALPGYATIGIWSVVLLIALRFVDGFFLGGEYTTAVPLAMEWSHRDRRGRTSGLITLTSPAASATIALLTLILLAVIPSQGIDSPYVQWGWRIPFVIGALLALVLFVVYRRSVEEPATERTARGARAPFLELVAGPHRKALLQVFVFMTGGWLATTSVTAVLPGLLVTRLGFTPVQVTILLMILAVGGAIAFPLAGILSDRIGRRPFYIGSGVVLTVVGGGVFALVMITRPGFVLAVVLCTVVGIACTAMFGPIAAYLTERFPARIRATGYGVGYSLALVLPSFYAFYLAGLGAFMPGYLAPVVLIGLAGVLVVIGAVAGPETLGTEMRHEVRA